MATVSSIATAIATQLAAIPGVNSASASSYLPAVANVNCVAFVIPFDQVTRAEVINMGGGFSLRHVLTCEFWTQVKPNRIGDAMTTARDIGALAITRLVQYDDTGYTLSVDYPFEERIASAPVEHAGVPWIITALRVPLENEVTV